MARGGIRARVICAHCGRTVVASRHTETVYPHRPGPGVTDLCPGSRSTVALYEPAAKEDQ
jgi:hypothetical protein